MSRLPAFPARAVLDTAYMAELRPRAEVRQNPGRFGDILREAIEPDVFFNHPAGQEHARQGGAHP
jgi:hypothetical protein